MLYCSWDMVRDRCYFFHFGPFFALLSPLTAPKIKINKKWRKPTGDIMSLHKCTKNHDHILHCSWDMAHDRYNCYFFHFGFFFSIYLQLPTKPKFWKKWKKRLDISSSYNCVPRIMIRWWADKQTDRQRDRQTDRQTDRQPDRQTEKVTEVGAPPKNEK